MSLRLLYLVLSVLAHMVVCVRRSCFGVNDCFCMVVITMACLGPSGSLPLVQLPPRSSQEIHQL